MKENVRLNKMNEIIEPIEGDARTVVMERFPNWADRILMPLPKSAHDFLDVAFAGAKNGAIVHFYSFAEEGKAFEDAQEKVQQATMVAKAKVEILNQKIVRPYAPHVVQTVTDFRVIKGTNKTDKKKKQGANKKTEGMSLCQYMTQKLEQERQETEPDQIPVDLPTPQTLQTNPDARCRFQLLL